MITIARQLSRTLAKAPVYLFSYKNSLVNSTPAEYQEKRVELKDNIWRTPDPTHLKSVQTHLSNGEYLIHKVPVVYVESSVARCVGGVEIGPGHPQVYIQLNTRNPGEPVSCKYCGMRYALKHHH